MDGDPPEEPCDVDPPAGTASRKRTSLSTDADTDDTELYSAPSDGDSEDGFQLYLGKKTKRRLIAASSRSSTSTVRPAARHPVHTILFVPEAKTDNLRLLNKQAVSAFLEATVPGQVKDVRINSRRNILAIDVEHRSALEALRKITSLQDIKVRAHDTPYGDTTAGVIYDVDASIPEKDLTILIKPADGGIVIRKVSRIGTSRCVKIVFKGDSLPAHVKVGHFRQPVRPYVPKPLQCHKCLKIGHVAAVCVSATTCPRCAGPHKGSDCSEGTLRCANCQGAHDASSKACPRMKREVAVLKQMVRDHSTHKEAAALVRQRRRHRSRRRRSSKKASHASTHDSTNATPPPVQQLHPPPIPPRPSPPPPPPPAQQESSSRHHTEVQSPSSVDAWPPLSLPVPPTEPKNSVLKSVTRSPAPTAGPDRQVVAVLRSLMNAIRTLLTSLNTPSALSALQVLEALDPVLASLG